MGLLSWVEEKASAAVDEVEDVGGAVVNEAEDLGHSAVEEAEHVGGAVSSEATDVYDKVKTGVEDAGTVVTTPLGGYVDKAEDYAMEGIHGAEDYVKDESHHLASEVSDVPILGSVANGMAYEVADMAQIAGGVAGGASTFVGGLAKGALDPVQTAKGLEATAEHLGGPIGEVLTAGHNALNVVEGKESISDGLNNTFNPMETAKNDGDFGRKLADSFFEPYEKSWKQGRSGEVAGRAIFDIGSMLLGGEEAEVAEGAEDAEKASEIAADASKAADGAKGAEDVAKAEEGTNVAKVDEGRPTVVDPAPPEPHAPNEPAPAPGEKGGGGERPSPEAAEEQAKRAKEKAAEDAKEAAEREEALKEAEKEEKERVEHGKEILEKGNEVGEDERKEDEEKMSKRHGEGE